MSNKDYREEARKLFGDNLVTEEHKKMIQRGIKSGRLMVVSHDDLSRPYHPLVHLKKTQDDLRKLLNVNGVKIVLRVLY